MARRIGYTDEEIKALDDPEGYGRFEPGLETALVYTEKMTRDAHTVTDELFAKMKKQFTDRQILEITCVGSMGNYFNRMTTALKIDLSGSNTPYDEAEVTW